MRARVNDCPLVGKRMYDAVLLHVGSRADPDPAYITAQHGPRADVAPLADLHVPDKDGLRMDKGFEADDGLFTLEDVRRYASSILREA